MSLGSWEFVDDGTPVNKEKSKKLTGGWEFADESAPVESKAPRNPNYELSDIVRAPVSLGASALARFGAVPKDLAYLAQKGIEAGSSIQDYLQDIGESPEQIEQNKLSRESIAKTTGAPFQTLAKELYEGLPDEKELKQRIAKNLPEGYLEPKSTAERVANEAASTLGGLLFPLTGGTKVKAGKALAEAVGGDVAKFMGHYLTGSEEVGEKAKIGTMLAVSLGLGSSLKSISQGIYNKIEKEGTRILPAQKPLIDSFYQLEKDLTSYGREAIKENSDVVKNVLPKIEKFFDGSTKLSFSDWAEVNKTVNAAYSNIPKGSPAGVRFLNFMKRNKAYTEQLAKGGGELGHLASELLRANEINTGVKATERAWNFFKNNPKVASAIGGYAVLPLILGNKSLEEQLPTLAGVGALGGAVILGSHIKNLYKLPIVRKEMAGLFAGAMKENANEVIKHARKLENYFQNNPKKLEYILESNQPKQLEYILDQA